jgi:hypothetical protein
MLRDRYTPVDLFGLVPALMLHFEPVLAKLDRLLDDDQLFQQVKADLSRRRPHTRKTGRPSTPVEVILRLLVVPHLYGWSYEQTEHFVGDSLVLRPVLPSGGGAGAAPHDAAALGQPAAARDAAPAAGPCDRAGAELEGDARADRARPRAPAAAASWPP